ncbi:hypothetical protein [Deinococcus aquaedulcis]|uniref:hypothetical protein n=1 Tax=Deinococcus aquaedulcis TaxID=2840455 RepID=UPI001C83C969|nr:hypothetical protein [Deinococcus aquaedulcis]
MKALCNLAWLVLLSAGQAGASWCVSGLFPETFHLDKVANISQAYEVGGDPKEVEKEMETYVSGLLRTVSEETVSDLFGNSSSQGTYSYTKDGTLANVDYVEHTLRGVRTWRRTYDYDSQGRLIRVSRNQGPGTPSVIQATCTYGPSKIFEKEGGVSYPRSYEYTLGSDGKVINYSMIVQGSDVEENTIITYRNGKPIRREDRRKDSSDPLQVTVTDYNDIGLAIKVVVTEYGQNMKIHSQDTQSYEYLLDSTGNWIQKRRYNYENGVKILKLTINRVIVYKNL